MVFVGAKYVSTTILLLINIFSSVTSSNDGDEDMGILYPIDSESRELKSLDGIWNFRADFDQIGFQHGWHEKSLHLTGPVELMPVPSSYNDITTSKELRDHVGWVWYCTEFFIPKRWKDNGRRIFLRFGSANRYAVVWVNGQHATNHSGGYLPFQAEIGDVVKYGQSNTLVVAVNNTLTPFTIPQGTLHYPNDTSRYPKGFTIQNYNFDYFNFAGIHRSVFIYTTPSLHISDITMDTDFDGEEGRVFYQIKYQIPTDYANHIPPFSPLAIACHVKILDAEGVVQSSSSNGSCSSLLSIPKVKLWWPYLSNPKGESAGYRYTLQVSIKSNMADIEDDVYRLKFGVRTVRVKNNRFLINGKPFYFQGFGRHEDYTIRGRGVDPVMLVKDHNLIQWIGANSYRTSHYPYAEEILDLTDQLGIVVISESPAIGLTGYWRRLKEDHIQVMRELVQRDKNRPSVMMWSIGNEPKSMEEPAPAYFEDVIRATRLFDPIKRPITIVLSQNFSDGICPSLDVISINRYFGWYSDTGRTEVIKLQMPTEVRLWYESYQKPVLVAEYGADSVAGMHQNPSFTYTEDYQVDYLIEHFKAFDELRQSDHYFIGEMVWNFADFATPPEFSRPSGCMKGVFTRERQPKAAAHVLRARYWSLANATALQYNLTECPLPSDLQITTLISS